MQLTITIENVILRNVIDNVDLSYIGDKYKDLIEKAFNSSLKDGDLCLTEFNNWKLCLTNIFNNNLEKKDVFN